MKKKIAVVSSAILAVVLLSGFAFRGGHGWSRDPERMKQMVTWRLNDKLDDLNVTDAQRQSIHGVKDRVFTEGLTVMEDNRAARAEALTQLESDAPDARKLHALVDERVDAMRAFAHKVTDAVLEVHRTLTPEQRKELATEIRERAGHR
jgi:Spy/CpxP family protein refolding chaperone